MMDISSEHASLSSLAYGSWMMTYQMLAPSSIPNPFSTEGAFDHWRLMTLSACSDTTTRIPSTFQVLPCIFSLKNSKMLKRKDSLTICPYLPNVEHKFGRRCFRPLCKHAPKRDVRNPHMLLPWFHVSNGNVGVAAI